MYGLSIRTISGRRFMAKTAAVKKKEKKYWQDICTYFLRYYL